MEVVYYAIAFALMLQLPLETSSTIIFYVLPISGAYLVVGIQWLNTLDLILTDYGNLICNPNGLATILTYKTS